MTNAQIIFMESCRLLEEGVIGTTGRKLVMEMPDGTKKEWKDETHYYIRYFSNEYRLA